MSLIFRDALSKAIRSVDVTRHQICARISELTGHTLSKDMLDKYTSSNMDYRIPAEILTAFCHAVGSIEPFKVLIDPLGYEVVGQEERELIRLAKLKQQRDQLDAQIDQLERTAGLKRRL